MAVASPQEEIRAQTKDRCKNSGNGNEKGCYTVATDRTNNSRYTIATHGTDNSFLSYLIYLFSNLYALFSKIVLYSMQLVREDRLLFIRLFLT